MSGAFKIVALIFIAVVFYSTCFGQQQERHWYFGFNAGLDFSSGAPAADLNGALSTDEGVASISDANGNLLFYTNGSEVYNAQHQLMPNGTGLAGHYSSSQSALIVPFQKDSMKYYIFTVPHETHGNFSYSVADLSLQGGLGDISQKNNVLHSQVCEKLTAVRHANGKTIWVVVHGWNNNNFYAYPVTCSGPGSAVVSSTGSTMMQMQAGDYLQSVGCMKLSRDGKKIAYTWSTYDNNQLTALLEIADFNNRTGVISNPVTIMHGSATLQARGYGVEFSPSSQFLYWSESGLDNGIGYSRLYQYDVTASPIPATETLVGETFQAMGSLQNGPDGKLYIARLNGITAISMVHNPDAQGTSCQFDETGVSTAPNASTWGLPNNWNTYPVMQPVELIAAEDTSVCGNDITLTASYPFPEEVIQYIWSNGSTDSSIIVSDSGWYSVEVYLECDTISDSIYVHAGTMVFSLGNDTVLCNGEVILSGPDDVQYLWNNGSTEQMIAAADSGLYILTVTGSNGCLFTDSIHLSGDGCGCSVFIPAAVTINGDGVNDHFSVYSACRFNTFSLQLFNRWGRCVFKSDNAEFEWNGEPGSEAIPQNIYAWYLEYTSPDHSSPEAVVKRGTVAFIR